MRTNAFANFPNLKSKICRDCNYIAGRLAVLIKVDQYIFKQNFLQYYLHINWWILFRQSSITHYSYELINAAAEQTYLQTIFSTHYTYSEALHSSA